MIYLVIAGLMSLPIPLLILYGKWLEFVSEQEFARHKFKVHNEQFFEKYDREKNDENNSDQLSFL